MFKILYGPYRIEDFPLSRNQRSEPWPSRSRAIGWHLDQLKFFCAGSDAGRSPNGEQ
jgi:hypothetical protein